MEKLPGARVDVRILVGLVETEQHEVTGTDQPAVEFDILACVAGDDAGVGGGEPQNRLEHRRVSLGRHSVSSGGCGSKPRNDADRTSATSVRGFARCGEHLGGIAPRLDAAIDVLHRARRVTRTPGITRQMVQLPALLNDARLQPAIAAVAGD